MVEHSSKPPSTTHPQPEVTISLEAQIHRAELAVITRDENLRRHLHQISGHVSRFAGRGAMVGVGAAILGALWLFLRPSPRKAPSAARAALGISVVEMLWSALMPSWRNKLPRSLSQLLFAVAIPAFNQLFSRDPASSEQGAGTVRSAEKIDLSRFLGRWYEIARLPAPYEKQCAGEVTATYQSGAKPGYLSVLNQCHLANGDTDAASGVARVVENSGGARLKVSFAPAVMRWLPWVWADYWVLRVAPDYRWALVGTPDRRGLWLLSRTPALPASDIELLVDHARQQGFATAELLRTRQAS